MFCPAKVGQSSRVMLDGRLQSVQKWHDDLPPGASSTAVRFHSDYNGDAR